MSDSIASIQIPVLPLRDIVVFPHMVIPLFIGRERSIDALNMAMDGNKKIFLITQKDSACDDPTAEDLYSVGSVASILQILKMPDNTVKVLVEGQQRARVVNFLPDQEAQQSTFLCEAELLEEPEVSLAEVAILVRAVVSEFEKYVEINSKTTPEVLASLKSIDDAAKVADVAAANLQINNEQRQQLLEIENAADRLEQILKFISSEIGQLQMEKQIESRVKNQMERNQKEYYLNEKIKAVQKELEDIGAGGNEINELAQKIEQSTMTVEAKEKAESELKKLKMMAPMSAEATVVRNYIECLLTVPWKKKTKISKDLDAAQKILDRDHYGLEKVKERIIEYLAVQKRVKKSKAAILCLVGPPGVGKTSLGESIAEATNRKFIRMSLGGVRDEAEIRGHRRTYIGSMPGGIIQKLTKVKVKNPFFMLDEADKMSSDSRGDPASALLEVLDSEQNDKFGDHYLEVDYDLSDVMFIATANTLNIPSPLLDRMEIIRIAGYTDEEKLQIAQRYLLPKQRKNNGLKDTEIDVGIDAIEEIINSYTREAGVRELERQIAKLHRKVVKELLVDKVATPVKITPDVVSKYLGVKKYRRNQIKQENKVGQVSGLAWTAVGGEVLTIESVIMPGKGKHVFTGKLGDVMQESITAAISVVRNRCVQWGVDDKFYEKQDIHVHVPEGATPKDGPSAGIGMCTAIVSALTGIPVLSDVAMTGEITLRGEILPIGGLKEKLLAAYRSDIKTVIIPRDNVRDLADVPDIVKQNLDIRPVEWIGEVIELSLQEVPVVTQVGEAEKEVNAEDAVKKDVGEITAH